MSDFNEQEYSLKLRQDLATIYTLQGDVEKEPVSDNFKIKLNDFLNRTARGINYKLYKLANKPFENKEE